MVLRRVQKITRKPPRLYSDWSEYFLTFNTFQRRVILDMVARDIIAGCIKFQADSLRLDLICFALLLDHVHILVRVEDSMSVSKFLNRLKSYTSKKIKGIQGLNYPVWQRGTFDRVVRHEQELEAFFNYIVYNPVKHGLVARPRDWPHLYVKEGLDY